MSRSYTFYKHWEQHADKVVVLDGLKYRLKVHVWNAIYPYPQKVISVHAVPVSKRSKEYKAIRQKLGDDWSTDVLNSTYELQEKILRQVEPRKEGKYKDILHV